MARLTKELKYKYNGESIKFKFYVDISPIEKASLVRQVVSELVNVNDNGYKRYDSFLREIIFSLRLVEYFTDISITNVFKEVYDETDIDLNKIYKWFNSTNLISVLKKEIGEDSINEIEESIDYNIQINTGVALNDTTKNLTKLIQALVGKVEDLDVDTISEFAGKFANGVTTLTPETIWNAYTNTDAFKESMNAIKSRPPKLEVLDKSKE